MNLIHQKVNRYLENVRKIISIFQKFSNGTYLEDKLSDTIQLADIYFDENIRLSKFLINFTNFLYSLLEIDLNILQSFFFFIIFMQIIFIVFSLIFGILSINSKKNSLIMKIIGNFNWIFSIINLICMSIFICIVIFIGSFSFSMGFELNDLMMIQNLSKNKSTEKLTLQKCFKNDEIKNEFASKIQNSSYIFEDLNTLYRSFLSEKYFELSDYFDQEQFLLYMRDNLTYIEDSSYAFVDFDNKHSINVAGNANAEFERLIDSQSSYPFQFYFNCSNKFKIQMTYDLSFCQVPYAKFNFDEDLLMNRLCYNIMEINDIEFNKIISSLGINNCTNTIDYKGEKLKLLDVLNQRFKELKIFFNSFSKYKESFFNDVITKYQ